MFIVNIIVRDQEVLHRWPLQQKHAAALIWQIKKYSLNWLKSENGCHNAVINCDFESLVEAASNPHQTVRRQNHSFKSVAYHLGP